MNKNILGATMLSLVAFVGNDCQATNLNTDISEIQVSDKIANNLQILKYQKIADNDLLNIWTSNDFKQKAIDNPKILSSFQNESVEIKIHEYSKNNTLSFVIPYFQADNLSTDELENLLSSEMAQTNSKQLPVDILARALKDTEFKEKLVKDPKTIFVDTGDMSEESNYDIRILEDTKEIKNVILPNSPINNDQLDMYKSKVAYLWGWGRSVMTDCDDPRAMLSVDCDGYAPYDTTIRIECTSKPTCM